MTRRLTPYLLSAPAALLVIAGGLAPLAIVLRVSLMEPARGRGFTAPGTWTLANYARLADAEALRVIAFTAGFALLLCVANTAAGLALALGVHALKRTRPAAVLALGAPKLAGAFVVLLGLRQLLGNRGPAAWAARAIGEDAPTLTGNLFGALAAESLLILPVAALVMLAQLATIDPAFAAAARGLGAGRFGVLRRITLPLAVPGIALAAGLSLAWGLGAMLGPMLLGGPSETTLAWEVHRQAFERNDWPRAAALAATLTALVGVGGAASLALARLGRRAG